MSGESDYEADNEAQDKDAKKEKDSTQDKFKKAIIRVEHKGRPTRLILTRRPSAEGYAWMKYEDDGAEFEASLANVKLVALLEG